MTEAKTFVDPSDNWTRQTQETWDQWEKAGVLGPREFEYGVTAGRPAWHGETEVHLENNGIMYVEDVLERYGFDTPYELHPIVTRIRSGGKNLMPKVEGKYAVVRMDKDEDGKLAPHVLPKVAVGGSYHIVQAKDALAFLNTLVEADRLVIESCVSLRGGAVIGITARKPENVVIAGETHIPYVNALVGFDGRTPIVFMATPVRFVCMNTVNLGIREAISSYRVKHTSKALTRLQAAREQMGIAFRPSELDAEFEDMAKEFRAEGEKALSVTDKYIERLAQVGNDLATFKANNETFNRFIGKLIPTDDTDSPRIITMREEKQHEIRAIWNSEPNLGNVRDTYWGILQSVIQWTDHMKKYKTPDSKVAAILNRQDEGQRALRILQAMK